MQRSSIIHLFRRIKRTVQGGRPAGLQLEITNQCNFKCTMCPTHRPGSTVSRPKGFMDQELYRKILSEFTAMGGSFLIPQGAGESFLHPSVIPFLEEAKKDFHLQVGLNTNGSHLNPETSRRLVELGIDELGFSIDALTEETFRRITGRTGLARIESNCRELLAWRDRLNVEKPLIRVLIVEQPENSHEIASYVEKWMEIVDEVIVQTLRTGSGRRLFKGRNEPRRPCRHLFDTMFVQWDGDVVICCEDWDSQTIVGNVKETSLKTIWTGPQMKMYRSAQKNGSFYPPEICRTCEAWAGGEQKVSRANDIVITETSLVRIYRKLKNGK